MPYFFAKTLLMPSTCLASGIYFLATGGASHLNSLDPLGKPTFFSPSFLLTLIHANLTKKSTYFIKLRIHLSFVIHHTHRSPLRMKESRELFIGLVSALPKKPNANSL